MPAPAASPTARTVPALFVGEGEKKVSVISADDPARDPKEALRARERRRHQQEMERLREEAETAASFRRIRNAVLATVAAGALFWGGWTLNQRWNGQWPILFTWGVMAVAMLAGFGWILWYMEKGD